MRRIIVCFLLLPLGLAACSSGPNVKSAKDYNPPPAPPVRHPLYNPYAAYGEANATWTRAEVIEEVSRLVDGVDAASVRRHVGEFADLVLGDAEVLSLAAPLPFDPFHRC